MTHQSGAPSHKYWMEMHRPSVGHLNGSKASHFFSINKTSIADQSTRWPINSLTKHVSAFTLLVPSKVVVEAVETPQVEGVGHEERRRHAQGENQGQVHNGEVVVARRVDETELTEPSTEKGRSRKLFCFLAFVRPSVARLRLTCFLFFLLWLFSFAQKWNFLLS